MFWIRSQHEESFVQSYLEIATVAQIGPPSPDRQAPVRDVTRYLETPGKSFLLVLDDLGDPQSWNVNYIKEFLPANPQCRILFTSRDTKHAMDLKLQHSIIRLPGLDSDAAEELLCSKLPSSQASRQDAATLVQSLGYIPMAILQAASFMSITGLSIRDYMGLLDQGSKNPIQLLNERTAHDFDVARQCNFSEVLLVTLQNIKNQNEFSFHILGVMSCVHSSRIPTFLLPSAPSGVNIISALGVLKRYSIVDLDNEGDFQTGEISAFVQIMVRSHLECVEQYREYLSLALERVISNFPETFTEQNDLGLGALCLSHARELLEQCDYFPEDQHNLLGELASRVTSLLMEQGLYSLATAYAKKTARLLDSVYGPDDTRTLKARSDIARNLRRDGRLEEAEEMTRKVLERRTLLLGLDNLDTLASSNHLAIILRARGNYHEAEGIYRNVAMIQERVAGGDNLNLMQTLQNLAITLQKQGREKYPEAGELYQRVLSWKTQKYGASDSRTLITMSNLGALRQLERKLEEAWLLHSDVFLGRSKNLGRMHPETIKSRHNMASVMQIIGYPQAAEPIMWQTVEHFTKVLGTENQETLQAKRNLASLLCELGNPEEARRLAWEALKTSRRCLGPKHPNTLASKRVLEEAEERLGEVDKLEQVD